MQLKENQVKTLLISSFRYALGRSTYITSDVADMVREFIDTLSKEDIQLMIKDIYRADQRKELGSGNNEVTWGNLRYYLEKKIGMDGKP